MADAPREGWTKEHDAAAVDAGFSSWEHWCSSIEAEKGFKICGRRIRAGSPCKKKAGAPSGKGKDTGHLGWGACGMHGGLSVAGPEHPGYVDGRRSHPKYRLSGELAKAFEELGETIQNAFDLTAEARLLDARMAVLVSGLPLGGLATPAKLKATITNVEAKILSGDPDAVLAALNELRESLAAARIEVSTWQEWRGLVEQKRKLADTHTRQRAQEHGPVTWPDLIAVVEYMRAGFFRFVPEERMDEALKYMRGLYETPGHLPGGLVPSGLNLPN